MFLNINELGSVIYGYQLEQITEGDSSIIIQAIETATEEVKGYLTGNNKKEWFDGRLIYDVAAIFSAKGAERNSLILTHIKTITKWYVVELCNADMIYEQAKERYDRATDYLKKVAKGDVTLPSLPTLSPDSPNQNIKSQAFVYGSRKKFSHE